MTATSIASLIALSAALAAQDAPSFADRQEATPKCSGYDCEPA